MWYGGIPERDRIPARNGSPRQIAQKKHCRMLCFDNRTKYDKISDDYGNCICRKLRDCPFFKDVYKNENSNS